MARNYAAEIESLRARSSSNSWMARYKVADLGRDWTSKEHRGSLRGDLFVIRLVTILEVATRGWAAVLIDHGEPYVSRASELFKRSGIRIDFETARAITGERITLGELVAHTLSTNTIGDIDAALSALLDTSIKQELQGLKDPWDERRGRAEPLVPDPGATYCAIQRLIECRHIVVHELPSSAPYEEADVENFISHVLGFVSGVDVLINRLIGSTALTQAEMNAEAHAAAQAADEKLATIVGELDPDGSDKDFQAAQAAWDAYRRADADYRSGINEPSPGSIAPLLWSAAFEKTTIARIQDLESVIETNKKLYGP